MIILDSARKHGVSDEDMLGIVYDPYVVVEIRPDPRKTLFLGFDNKARSIEVITDTGTDGQEYIIHADKMTKQYESLLEEIIK